MSESWAVDLMREYAGTPIPRKRVVALPPPPVVVKPVQPPKRDIIQVASDHTPPPPSLAQIMAAVVEVTWVHADEIKGTSRTLSTIKARHIFCYVASTVNGSSFTKIGKFLGGKDHTTILHARRRVTAAPDMFEPNLGRVLAKVREG